MTESLPSTIAAADSSALWRATREIFGGVPPAAKWLFYGIAAIAVLILAYGIFRRSRLWSLGQVGSDASPMATLARRFFRDVLLLGRFRGRPTADRAHALLYGGFLVLLLGTTLIAIEHLLAAALGRAPDQPVFHYGVYYVVFEIAMDVAGVALLAGCLIFAVRRCRRAGTFEHRPADWLVLALLAAIGFSGYILEGLRILSQPAPLPGVSPLGYVVARGFQAVGTEASLAATLHLLWWWGHALLALALIAAFPYTRLFHSIAGSIQLLLRDESLGSMKFLAMEQVEETGKIGVGAIDDFTRSQLRQLDACVACGRCQDACPAFESGKPLSPRSIVQDLRHHLDDLAAEGTLTRRSPDDDGELPSLHGTVIAAESLWSCTTCTACTTVCPLGISPVDMITDMRRHLVGMGEFRGSAATSLQKTQRSGNPWGLPANERFAWAEGLDVPTVGQCPDFEILYWVGCAAAYDRRVQKVARSVVRLLTQAGVKFAVLGSRERCTGESARRIGDEFLFQELAAANVETLAEARVTRIVTHCPHCLNSFRNDYPQLGGRYEVVHHSQLLAELVASGRLRELPAPNGAEQTPIVYHDPCYLARVNHIAEEPRAVLQAALGTGGEGIIREPPRCGGDTACCGAGGGRMWFDDPVGQRIGGSRIEELHATGGKTVAVSCPFCLIMVGDGMKARDDSVAVKDIAEILIEANGTGKTSSA